MSEALTYEQLMAAFQETRERQAETDRQMKASSLETEKKIREISELVGGISNNNGSVAEEYFYNSFDRTKDFAHEHFDYVERNAFLSNSQHHAEFGIIMHNGKAIAIIEVKYKPHIKDIEKVLEKQEKFRKIVSSSKDKTIYLGLAGLAFSPAVETATLEAGIAVIKQVGENMVIYLGKCKDGATYRRAMYIAKHRGSECSDNLLQFIIDERGVRLVGAA